jgi:AraC-like DNA-binding protein/mannose-6-phosphate isomerase-like protein (cupin superfamily)
MADNNNGNLPVFIKQHSVTGNTRLHRHAMMQINYVSEGSVLHVVNGFEYRLLKGDICVTPPYIPHLLKPVDKAEPPRIVEFEFVPEFVFNNIEMQEHLNDYSSLLDFSYIEPFLVSEGNVKPRLNLLAGESAAVEALLWEIEQEYTTQIDGYLLMIKALTLKLLAMLGRYFRRSTDSGNVTCVYNYHRESIERALNYIHDNYTESLSVESVARIALMSKSYFSYVFKSITGKSFVDYLNHYRVRQAMRQLKGTDKFVLEICLENGFNSLPHFSRTFKKIVGVSPQRYRVLGGYFRLKD